MRAAVPTKFVLVLLLKLIIKIQTNIFNVS